MGRGGDRWRRVDLMNMEVPNFNFRIFSGLECRAFAVPKSVVSTIRRFAEIRTCPHRAQKRLSPERSSGERGSWLIASDAISQFRGSALVSVSRSPKMLKRLRYQKSIIFD